MKGPINFVSTILWFGIGFATVGTLKDCTRTMAGMALEASMNQMSLSKWNQQLLKKAK